MTARAAAGGSFSARGHKRRCRGIDCPKTKAKGGRAYDRKDASAPLGAHTGETPCRRADKAKRRCRKPPQGTAALRRVAASFSASDRLRRAVCLTRAAQARAAGESFGLPRYACPMARARRGLYRGIFRHRPRGRRARTIRGVPRQCLRRRVWRQRYAGRRGGRRRGGDCASGRSKRGGRRGQAPAGLCARRAADTALFLCVTARRCADLGLRLARGPEHRRGGLSYRPRPCRR